MKNMQLYCATNHCMEGCDGAGCRWIGHGTMLIITLHGFGFYGGLALHWRVHPRPCVGQNRCTSAPEEHCCASLFALRHPVQDYALAQQHSLPKILAWSHWKVDRCPGWVCISLMQVTQHHHAGWAASVLEGLRVHPQSIQALRGRPALCRHQHAGGGPSAGWAGCALWATISGGTAAADSSSSSTRRTSLALSPFSCSATCIMSASGPTPCQVCPAAAQYPRMTLSNPIESRSEHYSQCDAQPGKSLLSLYIVLHSHPSAQKQHMTEP